MPQNIYDDGRFFAAYRQLPRSVSGLAAAPEWPSLQKLLPEIEHARVLDLGCGYGWFVRWARERGAESVVGVDLSERMLEEARARTNDAAVTYVRADLNQLELDAGSFELAYSSLALHYVEQLELLLARVRRALRPGGRFVFSVEHPMFTAPRQPGFIAQSDRFTWPVDGYLDEGPRTTNWLAESVIKQHRTLATYVNLLVQAGFAIERLVEWGASAVELAAHPEWHRGERERPAFLLVSCSR